MFKVPSCLLYIVHLDSIP